MWRKRNIRDSVDLDELKDLAVVDSKHWVSSLFIHMYYEGIDTYILERSSGIPDIPTLEDDLPSGELSFDGIINRLKVFTGLDPVQFKEPKHGSVSLVMFGNPVAVETTFCDSDENTRCTIAMTKE
jgi:hypothetical protein